MCSIFTMKCITIAGAFILFIILSTTKSFVIQGDLTFKNKESAVPIVLNDDINDIQKRQNRNRQKRARQRRKQQRQQQLRLLQNTITNLSAQLSSLQSAVMSKLISLAPSQGRR
uniref:BZIP domain-containing protein n=1 Tax=Strongyloides venezuelensis TaxID=75913 RepID=A0A0K0FT21_STRVS